GWAAAAPGATPIPGAPWATARRFRRPSAIRTTASDWRASRDERSATIRASTAMAGEPRSVLREGIVAGLIGAAVVALWFFVYDIARGTAFRTPTLLGAFVFFGIQTPTGLDPAPGLILGYTVLHGLAFIAFGVIAASLMAMSDREPALFIGFIILFACFEAFFFAMVQVFGLTPKAMKA